MAVAHENTQTTNWTSTSSLVITKPTGLAVGDILISFVCGQVANVTYLGLPANFNEIESDDDGTECWRAAYKIADASDVAASNFTFPITGGPVFVSGSLSRISGVAELFTVKAKQKVTAAATTTLNALDLVPIVGDWLVMFFGWHTQNSPGTHSNYTMATSNPSWTEAYDYLSTAPTPDYANFMAHAMRTQSTATGDFTVDCTGTGGTIFGFSLGIMPRADVSLSMPVGTLTLTGQEPSLTIGIVFPMPVGELTINGQIPTITTSENTVWTEETKNSATWTEESK